MKWILAFALMAVTAFSGSTLLAAGARVQPNGSIAGTATSQTGETLPNVTVQLRDLSTGQVVQTKTTNEKGEYIFSDLPAGNFAVEAVNAGGQVIGTSASISVTAGQAVTGVALQANAGLLGAGGAAAAAGAGGAGKGVAAAVMIAVAAGTAFIGAQTSSSNSASPSR
ncbi:MAG TPA: carboxypeptidase-like regulatory domain-containing protein [Vicinamibacterales bacterium]|nr:carboxypeptidase-like regulatory domain-containing protein [Vicinamibacterales bacterium]